MSAFFSDLRFAVRQLRRDLGFSLAAILTLGVGIGATTVIFSVFNSTVLRDLPYPESEQLVRVTEVSHQDHIDSLDLDAADVERVTDQLGEELPGPNRASGASPRSGCGQDHAVCRFA